MANNAKVYGDQPIFGLVPATITLAGGVSAHRFILGDLTNYCGSGTAATDADAGVVTHAITSAQVTAGQNETNLAVGGIALVETGDAVNAYGLVMVDTVGRAIPYTSGLVRGKALAVALGSGDVIPILLNPAG